MLVLNQTTTDNDVVELPHSEVLRKIRNKAERRLNLSELAAYKSTRPKNLDIFSTDKSPYSVGKHPLVKNADIIHLHWIAEMVDYAEFFPQVTDKPIVWTLHDMNPFTGGCHYSRGCRKYESMCGACPQLGSGKDDDLSKEIWARKECYYRDRRIHVVTPSRWLADCARKSQLFKKHKVEVIPNSVQTTIFEVKDKKQSREYFNLPKEGGLILFGAENASNPRKGIKNLTNALGLLEDKIGIGVVIFGSMSDTLMKDIRFPVYPLGAIKDEASLAYCYSAADVFVIPSLEDNLPNTVLESMACGTPVVGSDVGGIPDMVKPGKTGALAKAGDVQELADGIQWMMEHPEDRRQMGINAREVVGREYTLEIQARRFIDLYESYIR
jgi:glycosyltransferase involved in cell wall biosynthesis